MMRGYLNFQRQEMDCIIKLPHHYLKFLLFMTCAIQAIPFSLWLFELCESHDTSFDLLFALDLVLFVNVLDAPAPLPFFRFLVVTILLSAPTSAQGIGQEVHTAKKKGITWSTSSKHTGE